MGRLTAHKISRNATAAASRSRAQNSADTLGRASLPHPHTETTLPNAERIKRSYGYDDAGNLTNVADALRGHSTYQYDALSRIRAAERAGSSGSSKAGANPDASHERFDFDPAGNLLNANAGGGNAQSSGGVSSSQIYNNRIAVFQDLRFAYDEHGNVIERLEGWHTQQHFSYSAEHQLTRATVTRFAEKPDKQSARRLVAIDEDADDAIKRSATTQTTHYRYDPLGRRIDKTDAFGSTRFIYDGDLLVGELRGAKLSEYIYEPDSFVPLAKLESQWGGALETSADANNDASTSGATKHKQQSKPKLALVQSQGSDAERIAPAQVARVEASLSVRTEPVEVPHEAEVQKSYAVYYYQCDQIGAPQELTDEQGRIVWAASYKVWGETQALQFLKTGTGGSADAFEVFAPNSGNRNNASNSKPKLSLADSSRAQTLNLIDQPLRFQGQYFDQETGLHYNRFRYYDPVTGRFIHQDPIGLEGGENAFVYAANASDWSDPLGLKVRKACGRCRPDPCGIAKHKDQPSPRRPKDSHHAVQDEWAKSQGLPGYRSGDAPSILLNRSPNHSTITTRQNARRDSRVANGDGKWSTSAKEEFNYSSEDLRAGGVSDKCRKKLLKKSYKYFDNLGAF